MCAGRCPCRPSSFKRRWRTTIAGRHDGTEFVAAVWTGFDAPSKIVFALAFVEEGVGGRERNNLYSEEAHDNLVRLGGFLKPELAVAEREVAKVEIAA